MRYFLILFACAFMVAFGAISLVQSYTPASAGIEAADDDGFDDCHDDGDDDNEPADGPDREDNQEFIPDGELHDIEDEDPIDETDDSAECGRVGDETATPCPSVFIDGTGGSTCCPDFSQFGIPQYSCVCPRIQSGSDVSEEGVNCVCELGGLGCLCEFGNQDLDPNVPQCCEFFGSCQAGEEVSAADADCDGSVTVQDAYTTLVVLSGFEASTDCGRGDADCSDGVDAKDTLAILAVVAGLEVAPSC